MTYTIQSFYQSKSNIYKEDTNKIDTNNELFLELSQYLEDILEEIRIELKNTVKTRYNYWKDFKKKPRILSKYLNIDNDSKYILEINKLNNTNIEQISDTICSYIDKEEEKDISEKLNLLFSTIINKYINESSTSNYYLDFIINHIGKKYDKFNTLIHSMSCKILDIIGDREYEIKLPFNLNLNIADDLEFTFTNIENVEHLSSIVSTLYKNYKILKEDFICKLMVNFNAIDDAIEWSPINEGVLEFRLLFLLSFINNHIDLFYDLDTDTRRSFECYLDTISNNNYIPLKLQVKLLDMKNTISEYMKKKTSRDNKNSSVESYSSKTKPYNKNKNNNNNNNNNNDYNSNSNSSTYELNKNNNYRNRNNYYNRNNNNNNNYNNYNNSSTNNNSNNNSGINYNKKKKNRNYYKKNEIFELSFKNTKDSNDEYQWRKV
jgi:hypothetical protein